MSLHAPRCQQLLAPGRLRLLLQRWLSPQQTSTALRPFYFVVHPDLFGQFPKERATNEQSLKKLAEYLSALETKGRATPTVVTFYLRDPSVVHQDTFPCVSVALDLASIRATVTRILESCRLSLDYLKSIPTDTVQNFPRKIKWDPSFYAATGRPDPTQRPSAQPRVELTLLSWLRRHSQEAEASELKARGTMADIQQLREGLLQSLGVEDVRWECVWSITYFRSTLIRFQRLVLDHPSHFRQVLQGRILIFGNNTGVSTQGHIVLSSDDVPTTWLKLLGTVPAYDAVLARLPVMEAEVSRLLNLVQICQHKRHQLAVMARDYELLLDKLLNSLRRCRPLAQELLGTKDLSHLQLVVEDESGPLMLTPTGQILIPASLPGSLVLEFIASNQEEATLLLQENAQWDSQEGELLSRCREELELEGLERDRSVSSREMADCCQRLMGAEWNILHLLQQRRVLVSTYYSVSFDGQLVIPWNWKAEE